MRIYVDMRERKAYLDSMVLDLTGCIVAINDDNTFTISLNDDTRDTLISFKGNSIEVMVVGHNYVPLDKECGNIWNERIKKYKNIHKLIEKI